MAGRKKKNSSNRTEKIVLRVTPEQKKFLTEYAKRRTSKEGKFPLKSMPDVILNHTFAVAVQTAYWLTNDEIDKLRDEFFY